MIYTVTSNFVNLFGDAMFNEFGETNVDIVSATSKKITIFNLDTGVTTEINGSGLTLDGSDSPTSGTITSFNFSHSGNPIGSVTDISWGLVQWDDAIIDIGNDDFAGFVVLLNQQPITIDLRNATGPMDLEDILETMAQDVTSAITVYDSPFDDDLMGGSGNDTIFFGGSNSTDYIGDSVEATLGNDIYDFSGISERNWVFLDYDQDYAPSIVPITATISGTANTGTISGAGFTHTLVDVAAVMSADGLGVGGSIRNDTFNATVGEDQWISFEGTEGNDTFNIDLDDDAGARLDFRYGQQSDGNGLNINIGTGVIANDGLGFTDTLNLTGDGYFEIRGTFGDDTFVGSVGTDAFITERGNDSVDGGDGDDTLRYNRSGVGSLTIDAQVGIVTGTWDGFAFTDTFTNIERIRGSREDDVIFGSAVDDRLEGEEGNDTIYGGDGDDRLYGDDGNDVIHDGAGSDDIIGWTGDDIVYLHGSDDYDYVDLHSGIDIIDGSNHTGGFLTINHWDLQAEPAFTITVDFTLDTAVIDKGANGTTTVTNINNMTSITENEGVRFHGTRQDDVFNIELTEDSGVVFLGGRGDDTFNITGELGEVYLQYFADNHYDDPLSGINVNLAAGIVSNDGLGGTDTIVGGPNAKISVVGTQFADVLIGSDGDDGFNGFGGDDQIDGGEGHDTARFGADLGVTAAVIVDLKAGTAKGEFDGQGYTASLSNIEEVVGTDFADVLVGDDQSNDLVGEEGADFVYGDGIQVSSVLTVAGQVYRLYQATLDRAPDTGGHAGWSTLLETGQSSLQDVARGFVRSPEFQNVYDNLDNPGFVGLLYQNVLNRAGSASDIQAWTDLMDGGMTQEQVVIGFSQSQEFQNNTRDASNAFAFASTAAEWSDDVYRLYQATLDRAPDVVSFKAWANLLATGTTLEGASAGFVNSQQFQNNYGEVTDSEFVGLLYQNVLNRTGSESDIKAWTDIIDEGATRAKVVLGFSQSTEFRNSTADSLTDWMRDQGQDDKMDAQGDDKMMGGMMSDVFVFEAGIEGHAVIQDFELWDILALEGFGYADDSQEPLNNMTQVGADVVFEDQDTTFTLLGVQLADLDVYNFNN